MKLSLTLSALAVVATAGTAGAATVVANTGAFSSGSGGEFNAVLTGASFTPGALTNSGSFETFCLELSEQFTPGDTYQVDFGPDAVDGGGGGSPDPLDEKTAFLYQAFINGSLPGYDYGNTISRPASAGALQNVIWFLEQETGGVAAGYETFLLGYANGGIGQGLGGVQVMNLHKLSDDGTKLNAQSLLVTEVPAPGSIALASIGGLLVIRRRR